MARIGFLTEAADVGTSVIVLPLYHPAMLAKQLIEFDRMFGGRIKLGIGTGGEYDTEFLAVGVPVSECGSRTSEAIEVMKQLWRGKPVTFSTKHGLVFEECEFEPPPLRPGGMPIIVGGRAEPAMRRAARLGDGWQPSMYTVKRYAQSVETIRGHAAELGRDLDGFHWGYHITAGVSDNPARDRLATLEILHQRAHPMNPAAFERVTTFGDADSVTEEMVAFVDAGVRHFVFTTHLGNIIGFAETMLGEILPRLERHAASVASITSSGSPVSSGSVASSASAGKSRNSDPRPVSASGGRARSTESPRLDMEQPSWPAKYTPRRRSETSS
jgi:alkanesulfonate monooxygenase SsuD/methylene tetrahydromethanopterin reductase-like flavin-dependent oxidoreductase (luciferase family)